MQPGELPCYVTDIISSNQNKRFSSTYFWIKILFATLLVLGVIGVSVWAIMLNKSSPAPYSCVQIPAYKWLKDVPFNNSRGELIRASLFSGKLTYDKMKEVCKGIGNPDNPGRSIKYAMEDEVIVDVIASNMDSIFESLTPEKKLMWTGSLFKYDTEERRWKAFAMRKFNNDLFCDKIDWQKEFRKLITHPDTKLTDIIYVVKDYGRENSKGCWQLYLSNQLASIMGQPADQFPRLSFACILTNHQISGQDALPSDLICDSEY